MAMSYDAEISREDERPMKAEKELEIFSALKAVQHEHERIRDFINMMAKELEPFLAPEGPLQAVSPQLKDDPGSSSPVVQRVFQLRADADDIAEHLMRLRARIR